ncbi:glycine-rich RNA-binding protein 3, mitochondrial-like [Zingiber officinale]|uniref:glycine-rich RNA-binding protein 3, mitochondrial-like n=1 Tax=Zingiber officinale TaxID=94328 RepID=UPI001C4B3336|nr:glycine-rich RNA-binding protein 3, mitochondrial-like [Zingiber officinale]
MTFANRIGNLLKKSITSGSLLQATRETGQSKGFGFVTFTYSKEASASISGMDGKNVHGRMIRVNYATDQTGEFHGGGYGGSYGSGGYGGGGGAFGGGYGGAAFIE